MYAVHFSHYTECFFPSLTQAGMSLRDTACYTLTLIPSFQDPRALELVEVLQNGKQESRYARVREKVDGEVYSAAIYGQCTLHKQIVS